MSWYCLLLYYLLFFQTTDSLSSVHTPAATASLEPLFRFGIIGDIQYCSDIDNAPAFKGMRRYMQSLDIYKEAINEWNSLGTKSSSLTCAVCLGDQLDGKTATLLRQNDCLQDFLDTAKNFEGNMHYCFGNHDHYTFERKDLYRHFIPAEHAPSCSPTKLYYDFEAYPGWRFIMLDSYDVSMCGSTSNENKEIAIEILRKNNPSALKLGSNWFKDLPKENFRYVPYNGGVSEIQLMWLRDVLAKAHESKEKVIVFCHQPIYSPLKPHNLVWNSEEVLSTLQSFGNTVQLYVAGHDHGGQYAIDETGIHHLVPAAPLECDEGEVSFGHCDVYEDQFILRWKGKKAGRDGKSALTWPSNMNFKT